MPAEPSWRGAKRAVAAIIVPHRRRACRLAARVPVRARADCDITKFDPMRAGLHWRPDTGINTIHARRRAPDR
jgi:hypothetical protein